jgi:hypothetical protein
MSEMSSSSLSTYSLRSPSNSSATSYLPLSSYSNKHMC